MLFKALKKGDIMREDDYVADEESFHIAGKGNQIGKPWNKTAYYPRYRKVDDNEKQKNKFPTIEETIESIHSDTKSWNEEVGKHPLWVAMVRLCYKFLSGKVL